MKMAVTATKATGCDRRRVRVTGPLCPVRGAVVAGTDNPAPRCNDQCVSGKPNSKRIDQCNKGGVPVTPSHTRPGGRSARIRVAVHRAVEELLAEGPAEALTIPLIAAHAGVHPT